MKCPYLTTTITIEEPRPPMVNEYKFVNIDEVNEMTVTYCYGRTTTQIETTNECLESECAAWQDGRCIRRA